MEEHTPTHDTLDTSTPDTTTPAPTSLTVDRSPEGLSYRRFLDTHDTLDTSTPDTTAPAPTSSTDDRSPEGLSYRRFLTAMQDSLSGATDGTEPLFTTDVSGDELWAMYLLAFPRGEHRRHHDCKACRQFVMIYGGLVTIEYGETVPALWFEADYDAEHFDAIWRMSALVAKARVTGVFSSQAGIWGTPTTWPWRHLAVYPDRLLRDTPIWCRKAPTPWQFQIICAAVEAMDPQLVADAVEVLRTPGRAAESVLATLAWMVELRRRADVATASDVARLNILWYEIASAPAECFEPLWIARCITVNERAKAIVGR